MQKAIWAAAVVGIVAAATWPARGPGEFPFVVQSHIHGSLSEDGGTMRGQTLKAREQGVDVLWWTDHAEFIEYYGDEFGRQFDFTCKPSDQPNSGAPLDGDRCASLLMFTEQDVDVCPEWTCVSDGRGLGRPLTKRFFKSWLLNFDTEIEVDIQFDADNPNDDQWALRLHGTTNADSRKMGADYSFTQHPNYSMMSDIRLSLDIKVDTLPVDAWYVIDVKLSSDHDTPEIENRLIYYVSGTAETPRPPKPGEVWIRIPDVPIGSWTRLTLDVANDARASFPDGDDQALLGTSLAIRTNGSATLDVWFDDFAIEPSGLEGQPLFDAQRTRLDSLQAEFGRPFQLQAQELFGEVLDKVHVNVYGTSCLAHHDYSGFQPTERCSAQQPRLDWCRIEADSCDTCEAGGLCDPYYPANVRDWADALGPDVLLSYNHMFGFSAELESCRDPAQVDLVSADLLSHGAYGVDVIEVGYKQRALFTSDFMRVWDRLGGDGLWTTGTGVSDSHRHNAGDANPFAYVALVQDDGDLVFEETDLIRAVRRGRVVIENLNEISQNPSTGRRDGWADLQVETTTGECLAKMGQVWTEAQPSDSLVARFAYSGLRPSNDEYRGRYYIFERNPATGLESYRVQEFTASVGGNRNNPFISLSEPFPAPQPGNIVVVRAGIWRSTTDPRATLCCDNIDKNEDLGQSCSTGYPPVGGSYEMPVLFTNPVFVPSVETAPTVPCERVADCTLADHCG